MNVLTFQIIKENDLKKFAVMFSDYYPHLIFSLINTII